MKVEQDKRAATLKAEMELREKEWRLSASYVPMPAVTTQYVRSYSPIREVVHGSPVRDVRYGSPYRAAYTYGPGYPWAPPVDYRMSGSPIRAYSPGKKSTLATSKDQTNKDQIDSSKK